MISIFSHLLHLSILFLSHNGIYLHRCIIILLLLNILVLGVWIWLLNLLLGYLLHLWILGRDGKVEIDLLCTTANRLHLCSVSIIWISLLL